MSEGYPLRIDKSIGLLLLAGLLQACVAVSEGPTQDEKASAVNVQLGIGYLQQNNFELASEKLNKALRQDPKSAPAHNAYAILQERLGQNDKAEIHYKEATELDPEDSQSANNYGTFLCRNGRELESEKYFLQALDNPLYRTPEFAYTNAAVCLMRVGQVPQAKKYLSKALRLKSDFAPALLAMGGLLYEEQDFENAQTYIDRFHLLAQPNARSLSLSIRIALDQNSNADVSQLVQRLGTDFPNSLEYKLWKSME
jgi:type IV pilus assembly protein PilF